MIRAVIFSFLSLSVVAPTIISAAELDKPEKCEEALSKATWKNLVFGERLNPEEVLKEVAKLSIKWEELVAFVDPGKSSKETESFPSREKLKSIFGAEDNEANLKSLLIKLGRVFQDGAKGRLEGKIPAELLLEGAKIGDKPLTRFSILELFIARRLLGLSPNPRVAVTIAWTDIDSRKLGYFREFQTRISRLVGGVAALPISLNYLMHPILTAQIFKRGIHYWVTRRLVNGKFAHPALAETSVQELLFLLENASVRLSSQFARIEDFPVSFQTKLLTTFREKLRLVSNAKKDALFPGDVNEISEPDDYSLETLKEMELEALEKDKSERPDMSQLIAGIMDPSVSFARQRAFEQIIKSFEKEIEDARIILRDIMIWDLEEAYKDLSEFMKDKKQVVVAAKAAQESDSVAGAFRRIFDNDVLKRNLRGQTDDEFVKRAKAFAKVFLEAEVLSELLRYRLEPKYEKLYERNPAIKFEGIKLLLEAEQTEAKRTEEDRAQISKDFAERIISNATTGAIKNPADMTMKVMQQATASGFFRYFANKPILGRAVPLVMTALMISLPFIIQSMNESPSDSVLFKLASNRATLTDQKAYEDARFNFLQTYSDKGITSADKKVLERIFKDPRRAMMPASLQRKISQLEDSKFYDSWAIWTESKMPTLSRSVGNNPLTKEWSTLSQEMTLMIDTLRDYSLWQMQKAESISRVWNKGMNSKSPAPAK